MFIRGGAPTISHNKIQNNVSFGPGGGIRSGYSASPLISNNLVYSNTTDNSTFGQGGGIHVSWGNAVITGNEIISNVAETEGGGIFVSWNTPATIFSNTIAYNAVMSTTNGVGGGIRAGGDSVFYIISHNNVYKNLSPTGGVIQD